MTGTGTTRTKRRIRRTHINGGDNNDKQKTYALERRADNTARRVAGATGRESCGDGSPEQEPVRVFRYETCRYGGIAKGCRSSGEKRRERITGRTAAQLRAGGRGSRGTGQAHAAGVLRTHGGRLCRRTG
ncbi:MAG: hypothetical protein KH153_03220 [Bacteroidales bacterium]|nr:hypothetical protein [Bacteroidales bacterium]